jgi:hypothetical protein
VSPADLVDQARDFAAQIGELLNSTVTHGIPIGAVLQRAGGLCYVGYGISRQDPIPTSLIPLTISQADPSCYLELAHFLRLDDEGQYLMDVRASFGLHRDADMARMMVRYDYVRDEGNHPSAHVHVGGRSEALEELCDERRVTRTATDRRHFPVGGKRFRPCLEDLIEFAADEGLVDAKEGWERVVAEHRARFHQLQLKAVVRRDPAVAAEVLGAMGWTSSPPSDRRRGNRGRRR